MTPQPVSVRPVVRVGELYDTLCCVKHHCFPVVVDTMEDSNSQSPIAVFCGTVTRKVICTLLKHKAFAPPSSNPNSIERMSPLVNWGTLEHIYPHYPDVTDINLSEADADCWLDLRPYIDAAALSINEQATIQRAYRMFRTLGLRHLCVVDHCNQLQGIITRADLANLAAEAEELEESDAGNGQGRGLAGATAGEKGEVDSSPMRWHKKRLNQNLQHTIAPDLDLHGERRL